MPGLQHRRVQSLPVLLDEIGLLVVLRIPRQQETRLAERELQHNTVLVTPLILQIRLRRSKHTDVDALELSVDLSDEEIERRLADREDPEPQYESGVLAKYGRDFDSAANGAVTNPAAKRD